MILTCPNCATRYVVEDADLRAEGRLVRCSACSEQWRAYPGDTHDQSGRDHEQAPDAGPSEGLAGGGSPPPAEPPILEPGSFEQPAASAAGQPVSSPAAPGTSEPEESEPDSVEPDLVVSPVMPERRRQRRDSTGPIVAVAAVLLILVIAALIAFPQTVVRLAPAAASSYRALGVPVTAPATPPHG